MGESEQMFASENHPSRPRTRVRRGGPGVDGLAVDGQAGHVSDPQPIPLASAIRALRAELLEAVRAGEREELRFALGPVELELQVEAAREAGGGAGIKFWVASVGAKGSRSSSTTHTVRLSLTPVRVDAAGNEKRDVLVASELEERG